MEWSVDDRHLFCGDAKGNLTVSTIKTSALKATAATPQTLTQEGSAWAVKVRLRHCCVLQMHPSVLLKSICYAHGPSNLRP
eukprot:385174-Prorocentrum_minimum.AAC.1